jgi:hypothetical protein
MPSFPAGLYLLRFLLLFMTFIGTMPSETAPQVRPSHKVGLSSASAIAPCTLRQPSSAQPSHDDEKLDSHNPEPTETSEHAPAPTLLSWSSAEDLIELLCGPSRRSAYTQELSIALLGIMLSAAREGDAAAMEMMGVVGMINGHDDSAAAGWLELAALKDRPAAMYLLSEIYSRGKGRPVDGEAAMYWLLAAAETGSVEAMMRASEVMLDTGESAKVMAID